MKSNGFRQVPINNRKSGIFSKFQNFDSSGFVKLGVSWWFQNYERNPVVVTDTFLYIVLDFGMGFSQRFSPWHKPSEETLDVPSACLYRFAEVRTGLITFFGSQFVLAG